MLEIVEVAAGTDRDGHVGADMDAVSLPEEV